jgi:membrane peptidoglycan carboxypeptidase
VTAYGTIANAGKYVPHTTILSVKDGAGKDVVPPRAAQDGTPVASPQAAYIVTDILAGNTNPKINPFWGKFAIENGDGKRRAATLKTGTNNDAKDLNAYGFIAPPTADGRAAGEFALAVGAWNGNSDNSEVSTPSRPVFSIDVTTHVWQGFLAEASKSWAINDFAAPADGLVKEKIDPWTGLLPASGGQSVEEWFISGTQPTSSLPANLCGSVVLDHVGFEKNFETWMRADRDWFARARKGPGTRGGVNGTPVAYFYNGSFTPYGKSWGPFVEGRGCSAPTPEPSCFLLPTPDASGVVPSFELPTPDPSASDAVPLVPCPTLEPSPSESPSAEPSTEPTPTPTPEITPPPTEPPTPPPTDPPTEPPSEPPPSAAAPSQAAPSPGADASP